MIRIAVVEDNADLLDDIAFNLRDEGFGVAMCADAVALDERLQDFPADIVVLDIGLPGENGLSIARSLRRKQPHLGIVMLTARTTMPDRIRGMEEGADVYLGKPVDMRELALVLRALARRIAVAKPPDSGLILLAGEQALLTDQAARIELTQSETLVLARLARAPNCQVSRKQLIEALGAQYLSYDERRLEAIVSRLRKKLEAAGLTADALKGIRGVGYVLTVSLAERQDASGFGG